MGLGSRPAADSHREIGMLAHRLDAFKVKLEPPASISQGRCCTLTVLDQYAIGPGWRTRKLSGTPPRAGKSLHTGQSRAFRGWR